ncbi:MAG: hypothetical protein ACP5N3_00935 [Candidatus Nanoarchaeia archaeon]
MAKNASSKVGVWAFIIGVILALIGGVLVALLGSGAAAITAILIVLGLIVGFLNVTKSETKEYLLAAVSLVIVMFAAGSALNLEVLGMLGSYLKSVLNSITIFVVPATIVVAIKAIYGLAQD